ncbi:MAG TPA: YncE family protein [Terriglobales bacterium]|nr:YncE family protein [Terriglobales bacterium]
MNLKGKSGAAATVLGAVFGLGLFCSGCGEYFRPVANPVPQPGGDPQRTAHALVVSSNGSNLGTAVVIDVSGDTNVGTFTVGRKPVHAASFAGADYVVNRDDNSVATFTLLGVGNPPTLIGLPGPPPADATPASPVFVAPAGGKLFVAEPGLNEVADISVASNTVSTHIPVGKNPVALVATPDGTKLYCLNKEDGTVSVIFPTIDTVVKIIPVGASPVWGAVSSDGGRVFVLNQGSNTVPGTVSVIDTATDMVVNTFGVGAGSKYIIYQASQNRVYVASPGANSQCGAVQFPCLYVFENNTGTITPVSLAGVPCNGQHPIAVTALADGTRAYVADDVTNSVCVLNTTSNTFTKRICLVQDPANSTDPCVGSATPVFIASDSDSTRVYTANQFQAGPFNIQSISRADGVVTVTTNGGVPFEAGHPITIAGVSDFTYNGVFGITAVNASHTQFTYVQTGFPDSSLAGTGTATVLPYVSLIRTSDGTTVKTTSGGAIPLTIPAGGMPTFIAMTP